MHLENKQGKWGGRLLFSQCCQSICRNQGTTVSKIVKKIIESIGLWNIENKDLLSLSYRVAKLYLFMIIFDRLETSKVDILGLFSLIYQFSFSRPLLFVFNLIVVFLL